MRVPSNVTNTANNSLLWNMWNYKEHDYLTWISNMQTKLREECASRVTHICLSKWLIKEQIYGKNDCGN